MEPIAETKYGKVEGFKEDGLNKWFGIPYAKPPIRDLRFKRALQCEPWKGVKETKRHGSKPYQFMRISVTAIPSSEDCLYLNIWAPEHASRLPVFVWIYGGGYHIGECSDPSYDGTHFAKNGVVYVCFNYRLGILGFYDFTMYDDSFDSNSGVSDQIEALRWIKENIAAFGGDPNNITIAGQSAGASSVINMMSAPKAKGLFQKAIAESGLPGCVISHNTAKLNTDLFLNKINIQPNEVYKLKTMPPEAMKAAASWVINNTCRHYPGIYLPGPVLDDLLPELPIDSVRKGSAKETPLIIGTNKDEGTLFVKKKNPWLPSSWQQIETMLQFNQCEDKLSALHALYPGLSEKEQMAKLANDRAFLIDSIKTADAQSLHSSTWMYRFDYEPILARLFTLRAAHCCEIPLTLNNLDKGWFSYVLLGNHKKVIQKLRNEMHTAWLNFAKTGNPNGHLEFEWPQYNTQERPAFIFNKHNRVEINPANTNYQVWKDIQLYRNL